MILELDFSGEVPVYLQIRDQIVLGAADGRLKPGERLPAIRTLAKECGVNMMTVSKAYALLKAEGVIVADRRRGAHLCGGEADGQGKAKLGERARRELRLAAAEAKLKGMPSEEFLRLCRELYAGM